MGVSYGGSGQLRQRAGETCEIAKNVGVEEAGPRRPHFVVTEKNSKFRRRDRHLNHLQNILVIRYNKSSHGLLL